MSATNLPARIGAVQAMELLGIKHKRTFRKVVDANRHVLHRLDGEVRPKYLTAEILKLLKPKT